MKTRVLQILGEGIGGAERLVLDITRHLDLERYDITVLILGLGGCVTDLIDRKRVRLREFGCRTGHDVRKLKAVWSFLFSNQFDIIHNHNRAILTNLVIMTLRPRPVLIYHEHGMTLLNGSLKDRLFYSAFAPFYDVFIAIHIEMTKHMERLWVGPAKKIVVIENCVDVGTFVPAAEDKRESWDCQTVGTIARLIPEKGLDLFLEVARLVIRKRPNLKFMIVGEGPLWARIKEASEDSEFKGRLVLHGATSDVPAFLRSFNLFLFTSLIEPFGMTLIESLACGIPVVAAMPEIGGARRLLNTLEGVFLVNQRKPEALADAILLLLEKPDLLHMLGQAGRKHVVKQYAAENYVKDLDTLYQNCLSLHDTNESMNF